MLLCSLRFTFDFQLLGVPLSCYNHSYTFVKLKKCNSFFQTLLKNYFELWVGNNKLPHSDDLTVVE